VLTLSAGPPRFARRRGPRPPDDVRKGKANDVLHLGPRLVTGPRPREARSGSAALAAQLRGTGVTDVRGRPGRLSVRRIP